MNISAETVEAKRQIYKGLGFQLVVAIIAGIILGHFTPEFGQSLKPLGISFIKLVKMLIAPIIFCLVVNGIAGGESSSQSHIGRIGAKTLVYFEIQTTLALIIGMVVMNILRPGDGLNIDVSTLDASGLSAISGNAKAMHGVVDYLMHIIPNTFFSAFAEGEILQVLFLSIIFAFALRAFGEKGRPLVNIIDLSAKTLFTCINYIMKLAPIGAFGAISFTISKYGVGSLHQLAFLIATYYVAAVVFLVVCLGGAAWLGGFNIFKLMRFLKEELLVVLGTSSSEAALPRLMVKLEKLHIPKDIIGLVLPTGYTFNLDGTCINLTVLAVFIAQATNTHLTLTHELTLLAILLLTSKGAASVTGGSLVVLTATLASTNIIPVAGVAIILGIYQFISVGGAIINALGNSVATIIVSRWEGAVDMERLNRILNNRPD